MATYVLIAGAWHGSWCWSEVVPLLTAAGHRVLTPDLHGMKAGDVTVTQSPLSTWADQIADLIRAEAEPVTLLGHSRAGLVISEVAERCPEKVALLVYLSAFLLRNGQTLGEIAQQAANAADVGANFEIRDDGTCTLARSGIERIFYNRTPQAKIDVVHANAVAEPLAMFTTPVHVTEECFGTVARVYIECTHDLAVPLSLQKMMQAAVPVQRTLRLDSDHSPFFSMPTDLVRALEQIRVGATPDAAI